VIEDHSEANPCVRSRNNPFNPIFLADDGACARLFEEEFGKIPAMFQGLPQYLGKVDFRNHRYTPQFGERTTYLRLQSVAKIPQPSHQNPLFSNNNENTEPRVGVREQQRIKATGVTRIKGM
jgi:hypothetical protein